MSILKLEPGDKVHFTVVRTEEVQGKFGPQIKFVGTTPDDPDAAIFLNVDAATRQLGRIGFTLASAVGQTVEIARTEKNGTKYTDINRIATGAAPIHAGKQAFSSGPQIAGLDTPVRPIVTPDYGDEPGHHAAIAALQAGKLEGLFVTYERCFDRALAVATKNLPPAMVTHEGVAAQAATLFIQASQKGLAA